MTDAGAVERVGRAIGHEAHQHGTFGVDPDFDRKFAHWFDAHADDLARAALAAMPQPEVGGGVVESMCKAFADATGYYVPFHRGLSSPSADKLRAGMRAALAAVAVRDERVFVIMGNDFPEAVHRTKEGAEARVEREKARSTKLGAPNVYWRANEFPLED